MTAPASGPAWADVFVAEIRRDETDDPARHRHVMVLAEQNGDRRLPIWIGPAEAIAHGYLKDSPVQLFAADAAGDQLPLRCEGLMLSLLGTADAMTLKDWFSMLSEGGRVVDDLQVRPWGASDGQVIDRYGLRWLIGFEGDESG